MMQHVLPCPNCGICPGASQKITSEPLMDMVFKKPRLDVTTAQETGVCLYQALTAPPSQPEVDVFK